MRKLLCAAVLLQLGCGEIPPAFADTNLIGRRIGLGVKTSAPVD